MAARGLDRACFNARVTAMGFAMNLFMVQEFLAVLLLLALSTATILVFAVAFMLFHDGIRWALLWAKTVIRLAALSPIGPRVRRTNMVKVTEPG
jgi:cell division protein FtsW (lipid II flippase)